MDNNDAFRYETKKVKKRNTHLSWDGCSTIACNYFRAVDRELGKNEKLPVSANKYRAVEANILNKTKTIVDLR